MLTTTMRTPGCQVIRSGEDESTTFWGPQACQTMSQSSKWAFQVTEGLAPAVMIFMVSGVPSWPPRPGSLKAPAQGALISLPEPVGREQVPQTSMFKWCAGLCTGDSRVLLS